MPIFYYFLRRNLDDVDMRFPLATTNYLGEIGDFVDIEGIGFTITDYAVEYDYE